MQHANADAPYLGRHIIAEFFECDETQLVQKEALTDAMNEAARTAGATILSTQTTDN
jgi:S-adenosylmethionine/arginine decarboxylase-like enzyme